MRVRVGPGRGAWIVRSHGHPGGLAAVVSFFPSTKRARALEMSMQLGATFAPPLGLRPNWASFYRFGVTEEELLIGYYESHGKKAERAFAALFARLRDATWRVAFSITRSRALAEEAEQAGWLRVVEGRTKPHLRWRGEAGATVHGYVLRAVRERALDILRLRPQEPLGLEPAPFPPSSGPFLKRAILAGLDELDQQSPAQAEVFRLKDFGGLDFFDIAAATRTKEVTIRGQYMTAKRNLRACLEAGLREDGSKPEPSHPGPEPKPTHGGPAAETNEGDER